MPDIMCQECDDMCGIIAYTGERPAAQILVNGLKRLDYRGYDSAGIGLVCDGGLIIAKDIGRIEEIERRLDLSNLPGYAGIGHTRWATSGRVTKYNAHPHTSCNEDIAIVHNGVIENYAELIEDMEREGHKFKSECDSEIIAHLLEGKDWHDGYKEILKRAEGYWAVAAIRFGERSIFVARNQQPLVLGISEHGIYAASDMPALLPYVNDFVRLKDGEYAILGV